MRIAIIATGSRGDVEPYVALGKGLKYAGYFVRLITHQNFESLVKSHGLNFCSIESNVQDIAQSKEMSERLEKGSFLSVMSQMKKEAERGAVDLAQTGLEACQDVDAVLAGLGGLYVGLDLAEKFDLKLIQAYYIPFLPTKSYPSFLFPKLPSWSGGLSNKLSHHIVRQIMWQSFKSADKKVRKILSLPSAPFFGPYKAKKLSEFPVLYGFSPLIIEPSIDRPDTHITGYWFLDPDINWKPPTELVNFIENGPPPIYVGFGSMSNKNPRHSADLVLKALKLSNQRAVMLRGWNGLQVTDVPESVYMVDSVPFSWLFPRMAAVVHHGGAGTTALGLRAGVPSIIIPFFADQPFWGYKVQKLGVGPQPIPRRKLTAERLANTIVQTLNNKEIIENALKVGLTVQKEKGIDNAIETLRSSNI
jgi:sterol 3beta-glucosyltransferase